MQQHCGLLAQDVPLSRCCLGHLAHFGPLTTCGETCWRSATYWRTRAQTRFLAAYSWGHGGPCDSCPQFLPSPDTYLKGFSGLEHSENMATPHGLNQTAYANDGCPEIDNMVAPNMGPKCCPCWHPKQPTGEPTPPTCFAAPPWRGWVKGNRERIHPFGLKKIPRAFSLCKGPSLNLFRRPKPL